MTLHLSLSPESEEQLRRQAQAAGVSPEEFARRAVEQAVGSQTPPEGGTLSPEEAQRRRQALKEWFALIETMPRVPSADDSRGSIYSGRGE